MTMLRKGVVVGFGICAMASALWADEWSQSNANAFASGQLVDASIVGDQVQLFGTREIDGVISNASFEAGAAGWVATHDTPPTQWITPCGQNVGTDVAAPGGTGMPSDGSRYLRQYTAASYDRDSWASCAQSVDLTGVSELRFDVASTSPDVLAQLRIDGLVVWDRTTAGVWMDASVDVSSLSGQQTIAAYLDVLRTGSGTKYVVWDNFRAYRDDTHYVATGSLLSEEIAPPTLGDWQGLTYSGEAPAGTAIQVDVLDAASLALLAEDVTSGTDLAGLGVTNAAIRLRASFSTSNQLVTPSLDMWSVSYSTVPTPTLQLPVLVSATSEEVTPALIEVELSFASTKTVTVPISIVGGTASNGVDYTLADSVLVFAPGETNASIVVQIYDDDLIEGDETILVLLGEPVNAFPADANLHTLTILGDADGDGMEDDWEHLHFGDLSHDGSTDSDGDGLTDLEEFQFGTLPMNPDTDNDGLQDGNELFGDGTHGDTDGEVSDPLNPDTDGDGFLDGFEVAHGRAVGNPYDVGMDLDGDGLPDYSELLFGTDPLDASSPTSVYVNAATGDDANGDGSPGSPYASIQHAIDAAPSPAIVRVAAGMYAEPVVLKDLVALVGEGRHVTLLKGESSGTVISLPYGTTTTVARLSVVAGGTGISAGANAGLIRDVGIRDCTTGIHAGGSHLRVVNSKIQDTSVAIAVGQTLELLNCLITGNGTALRSLTYTTPQIQVRNCTIADNLNSIWLVDATRGILAAYNSIFWGHSSYKGNDLRFEHSCIDLPVAGPGVIRVDPLFVDVSQGDYRLRSTSLCIDAGNGSEGPPLDRYGVVRSDYPPATNTGTGTPVYVDMGYAEFDDTDLDGLRDSWELQWFGDLSQHGDGHADEDTLTNLEEMRLGTNPLQADTDGDGLWDDDELYGDGTRGDTDGFTSNPLLRDSDGDGIDDKEECTPGSDGFITNPNAVDSDRDGWSDAFEIANGTNPVDPTDLDRDDDGDGLPLFGEMILGTDPERASSPSTIYVSATAGSDVSGNGHELSPYATIGKAMSVASGPAIIRVAAGTYQENVVGKTNVALVGDGMGETIIEASGTAISQVRVLVDLTVSRGNVSMWEKGYFKGVEIRDIDAPGSTLFWVPGTFRAANCKITRNTARYIIYSPNGGDVTFVNCLIAGNSGYGVWAAHTDRLLFLNCTVYNNSVGSYRQSGDLTAYNSIFEGVNGGATLWYGNTGDPRFRSLAHHDYQLAADSPCIDAAEGFIAPATDLLGTARYDAADRPNANLGWPRFADIGCYEADFTDIDGDGLLDQWEMQYFGTLAYDADMDVDNDGLTNAEEVAAYTNPNDPDTDGDGLQDGDELYGDGTHGDTDGYVTDPLNPDTDGDGIPDGEEVIAGADGFITNPTLADTDGDGYTDGYETANGMDPTDPHDADTDTDGDGLPLFGEAIIGSDPRDSASPVRIYVNGSTGSDVTGDGSVDKPYATVQKGIDAASAPALIRVAAGTYPEQITVKTGMAVVGDGREQTIINAGGSGCPVTIANHAAVALVGLKVTGGNGYTSGINAPANNALYLYDVAVVDNSGDGAAFRCLGGMLRVSRCVFRNQRTSFAAYEMEISSVQSPVFVNVEAVAKNSEAWAVLRLNDCANPTLVNCVIVNELGRGVYFSGNTLTVVNSIFRTHRSDGPLDIASDGVALSLSHTCFSQTGFSGPNLMVADPRFRDPADNDYSLLPESPCIDAADGNWLPPTDMDQASRDDNPATPNTGSGTPDYGDLGCYEFGDTDGDGISDAWELQYFGDLSRDGLADSDGDGLSDREEYLRGLDPTNPDSDGDGLLDGDECYGDGTHGDTDGYVTDPLNPDTDGDGIPDGEEVVAGADGFITNPLLADTDYDGLDDRFEIENGLNPTIHGDADLDSDGDGLTDFGEIAIGSQRGNPDSPLVIHVDASSGSDATGDGSTGNPYATIQKGVDAVQSVPAMVKIGAGHYVGQVVLRDRVALVGAGSSQTTLDVAGLGTGITVPEGASTALAGFRIIDGAHSLIACPGNEEAPPARTISLFDVVATKNNGPVAVHVVGGTLRIVNCVIADNKNPLSARNDWSSLANLYCYGVEHVSMINTLIAGGENADKMAVGASSAGATFDYCPSVMIANCTIANNEPMGLAGTESHFTISNTIIWGNRVSSILYGTGSWYWITPWDRTVDVRFGSIVWRNSIVDDRKVSGVVSHANPRFISAATGNYQLSLGSPAIDAGFGNAAPAKDLLGMPRVDESSAPNTGTGTPPYVDLGCYEWSDTDHDGMSDPWEMQHFGSLAQTGSGDKDGDGLSNLEEFRRGLDPNNPDTDGDGLLDGDECYGNGTHGDTDGYVTNPLDPDTDGDGILDGEEVVSGADGYVTNPTAFDTDRDGISDRMEIMLGLNPVDKEDHDADTDGDGLPNFGEAAIGSDLLDALSPARLFVDAVAGSDATGDGSQFSPYASIGKALLEASAPAAIQIAAGYYEESLVLQDGIALIGAGAETTKISAGGAGSVIRFAENAGGALVGLHITGGYTNHAAGVYAPGTNELRALYLADVIVSKNVGGGLLFDHGVIRIRDSKFMENMPYPNTLDSGGGITILDSHAALVNSLVHHNTRTSTTNSVVTRRGDGIALSHSRTHIINCTVVHNKTYGISSEFGSLDVVNSIVFYNTPNSIYTDVRNDICGHGDISVAYSAIMNLIPGESLDDQIPTINRSAPRFTTDGKYALQARSPCIDAGHGDYAPALDYNKNARVDDPFMPNFGTGSPRYTDMGYLEAVDSDLDGLPDAWEILYFGDLSHNGLQDTDGDGLTDREEYLAGTSPIDADTDGDGILDGDELYGDGTHGDTDGFVSCPLLQDTDGDGIPDGEEVVPGADGYITDPSRADSDLDGLSDKYEIDNGLDPTSNAGIDDDADGDGLPTWGEMIIGSSPSDPASPPSIYVDAALGSDVTGDGSAGNPYATIGMGIDSTGDGPAMVKIAAGEYREPVRMKHNVALVGPGRGLATLYGGGNGRVIDATAATNCVVVGLTVAEGNVTGAGAGLSASSSAANQLYLCDVEFRDNHATGQGGGLAVTNGALRVVRTKFHRNEATEGGGVYVDNVFPCVFVNSEVTDNVASEAGDGILFRNSLQRIQIINSTIAGNDGQGLLFHSSRATLVNCVIWNNRDNIVISGNSTLASDVITRSCIVGNDAQESANALAFFDPAQGDYRITESSPLIDKGVALFMPPSDMQKTARWDHPDAPNVYGVVDIGAHEYADTDHDGLPDFWEMEQLGSLSYDGTDDPDGDGLDNATEFLLRSNPYNADSDGDGLPDGDEVAAGTDPNDATSFFRIGSTEMRPDGALVISWESVIGRVYNIWVANDLGIGDWQPLQDYTNIHGTGSSITYTNVTPATSAFYYIDVRQEF